MRLKHSSLPKTAIMLQRSGVFVLPVTAIRSTVLKSPALPLKASGFALYSFVSAANPSVGAADLILSNPPYIKSEEILTLQKEAQREPSMALDGGADGLDFYKILASDWLSRLPKGGVMAVECGEAQAEDVSQLFFLAGGVTDTINDLSGIQRVVTATKNR